MKIKKLIKMQSQFKEKKFESETEFEEWLKKKTHKKIFLKNKGQDKMKIYVSKSGEIIHANKQCSIWNGKFINMETLKKNTNIRMWNNETSEWETMNYKVNLILE
jgi:hypothetical protein